jgi:hypothetical protein
VKTCAGARMPIVTLVRVKHENLAGNAVFAVISIPKRLDSFKSKPYGVRIVPVRVKGVIGKKRFNAFKASA